MIHLYLALWFPWLSAERLRNTRPGTAAATAQPQAFIEKVQGALRLTAVDRHARALGLLPGMAMADARACVPDLRLFDHDPRADRLWLERLADGCLRYTPTVAFDAEDGLTLEIGGSAHLFGGAEGLANDLTSRLDRLGMTVRHAIAGTAEAAQALARHGTAASTGRSGLSQVSAVANSSPSLLGEGDHAKRGGGAFAEAGRAHDRQAHRPERRQTLPECGHKPQGGAGVEPSPLHPALARAVPLPEQARGGKLTCDCLATSAPDWRTAIRDLPVTALRLGKEREVALRRAGLNRVGDLLCRPLATVAARFGADAVAAIRAMTGETEQPIVPRRVEPVLVAERRFAEPLGTSDQALAVLRALADETALMLERQKQGGRVFIARFFRCDGLCRALTVASGRPTRDPDAMMRLFGERLETLSDPLDPGFGFDLIRLEIPVTDPLAAHQIDMDGQGRNADAVDALVDRLSIRVGRDRIRRLVPVDTHIPERAQRPLPAAEPAAPDLRWTTPADPDSGLPRPVRLFDPPQRIEVVAAVPDGPPLRFRWRRALHKVSRVEGPERIASEWWRRKDGHLPGQGGLTRDYYRVEDARGRRFWLFRHGLYGTEVAHPDWYVHGLFP